MNNQITLWLFLLCQAETVLKKKRPCKQQNISNAWEKREIQKCLIRCTDLAIYRIAVSTYPTSLLSSNEGCL